MSTAILIHIKWEKSYNFIIIILCLKRLSADYDTIECTDWKWSLTPTERNWTGIDRSSDKELSEPPSLTIQNIIIIITRYINIYLVTAVGRITELVIREFSWNFWEGSVLGQKTTEYIFDVIFVRTQKSVFMLFNIMKTPCTYAIELTAIILIGWATMHLAPPITRLYVR